MPRYRFKVSHTETIMVEVEAIDETHARAMLDNAEHFETIERCYGMAQGYSESTTVDFVEEIKD